MIWRVSDVESFRQFEEDDELDEQWLRRRLLHLDEPSIAMEAGTALHKILESCSPGTVLHQMGANGYRFMFRNDIELPVGEIREVRASKTFIVDGMPIEISGQLDVAVGKRVEDYKTTAKFDPSKVERYYFGYQWRLYLSIFGADVFRWVFIEMWPEDDAEIRYDVRDTHQVEQYRYPELEADCQAMVERFARFVRQHEDLLQPEGEQA